jgi:hypothetical protein
VRRRRRSASGVTIAEIVPVGFRRHHRRDRAAASGVTIAEIVPDHTTFGAAGSDAG